MNITIKLYNIVITYKWYFCLSIDLRLKSINLKDLRSTKKNADKEVI